MTAARRPLLPDPAAGGVLHCISRCVRGACLCGWDPLTKRSFDHRRGWVRDRLGELAAQFALDVHAYAVTSDHLHLVLGIDPGRAKRWSQTEVALRWLTLFPGPEGKRGQPPVESMVWALCRDADKLARCRGRLADVSWFMRCLSEPIARRANREDGCTGHFWEKGFKCQRINDAESLLATMACVELNPVRPGIGDTTESQCHWSLESAPRWHRERNR